MPSGNMRLGAFALRLNQAFLSWQSPSREPAAAYFVNPQRHKGDELHLRATLVKERILQQGFGYQANDVEIEAPDRADLVLHAGTQHRRPVAIVETKKSGFVDLLSTVQVNGETPPQQLERYVRLRGLYLGALTNGDVWHIIDFGVGLEPLASFSLAELATVLSGVVTAEEAERKIGAIPHLQHALLIAQSTLHASKWEAVDAYLEDLNEPQHFQAVSLESDESRAGLVQQVTLELGLLRDTIMARFALLQDGLTRCREEQQWVDEVDRRGFADVAQDAKQEILEAVPASTREEYADLLDRLVDTYLETGDGDWFFATYVIEGEKIAQSHSVQLGLLPGTQQASAASASFTLPQLGRLGDLAGRHHAHLSRLRAAYASSLRLERAYAEWSRRVRGVFESPEKEFCLQTSYIHFVRLFFVRVCEDYGLITRRISNGPFGQFDEYRRALLAGVSDVYQRLLAETFERAASVYHNFFARGDLYDWFKMDERSILGVLAVLNRYDFSQLDFDVLGAIYNQGYIEELSRSERGQFYTPHQVVTYMLDSLGMPRVADIHAAISLTGAHRRFVEETVIDISCGSASFLVEVAARKAAILTRMVEGGEMSPGAAVEYITDTLVGLDINPFACYLAEINLLMRCMPFLRRDGDPGTTLVAPARSVSRLHIYCCDSIEPTRREMVAARLSGKSPGQSSLPLLGPAKLSEEEQAIQRLKSTKSPPGRFGAHGPGFSYSVGNPPYVRADRSAENKAYRDLIRAWGVYHLTTKWDLFVPFVYRSLEFLAEGGSLALLTSNAVETEGYASPLRSHLTANYRIEQLDFFPGVRLFKDAGVHNTIFILSHTEGANPAIIRRVHTDESCAEYTETTIDQTQGPEVIFRHAYVPPPPEFQSCTVPLCAIAYLGTGLVAHSHETFDVEIDGESQRLFDLADSFREDLGGLPADERAHFIERGVVGADVHDYHLAQKRYVAYDHMASKMYRPRTPELFRTPAKLLIGETSGGYYDDEQLFANHSVQVVVPWSALQGVDELGVRKVRRDSEALSGYSRLEAISSSFDLRYVLAIANSDYMRSYLLAAKAKGTRAGRIYPDVWKEMPVKVVSPQVQAQVAVLVNEVQAMYQQLAALTTDHDVFRSWRHRGDAPRYFNDFVVSGDVKLMGQVDKTKKAPYEVVEAHVQLYHSTGLTVETGSGRTLLEYFCWYCNDYDPSLRGRPWSHIRRRIWVPRTVQAVAQLMGEMAEARQVIGRAETRIEQKKGEIEAAVGAAYLTCDDGLWEKCQRHKTLTLLP